MKNIDEVMEDFLKDFKEDPQGWSFWTDRSEDFYNIYVIQEERGYFIKVDSIYNKNSIGMGTEISVEKDQLEKKLPDFGFRRFKKNELKRFFESLSRSDDEEKKNLMEKKASSQNVLIRYSSNYNYLGMHS